MRAVLIHWNVDEAADRCKLLKRAGVVAEVPDSLSPPGMRQIVQNPPELFVIDLSRMPSHGRAVATSLRQRKTTRFVPLVFVDGEPAKVDRVRALIPDAVYCTWDNIAAAVSEAARSRNAAPVVPETMEAYRESSLLKKLGIADGMRVRLIQAPEGFKELLTPLPSGVVFESRRRSTVVIAFVRSLADLEKRFAGAVAAMDEGGRLWLVWPKKTSALAGDLTQQVVREYGMARGLVDFKICAVDNTWAGLQFSRRR